MVTCMIFMPGTRPCVHSLMSEKSHICLASTINGKEQKFACHSSTNIPTQGTRANVSNKRGRRAHLILRLRIPSIANASFEELWNIQQDEFASFDAFRRSIDLAIETAAARGTSLTYLNS